MTIDEFWQLIESTHQASDGDPEKQCALLIERLATMPVEDIFDYGRIQDQLEDEAYQSDIWNVAYIIGEGCGNDGFMDFRSWLIAQGKSVFERTLYDPDSLADYISVEIRYETQWEGLLYVEREAYERKLDTKELLRFREGTYPKLKETENHPLTEDAEELKMLYPKMWAKFGW